MNVLVVTNIVKTYSLGHQNVIETLVKLGHDIIWAANFSAFVGQHSDILCETIDIGITSNPLKKQNVYAYRKLVEIIRERNIEAVYCSTPIGGTLARLAAKRCKVSRVIYAAHGFLFFDGVPVLKRELFRLHERLLARWTDALITITQEDCAAAQEFKLRSGAKPYLVHGAGVEVGHEVKVDREKKRNELGIPRDAVVVISGGFLNKNKNNIVIVDAMAQIKHDGIYYIVCGEGEELAHLRQAALKHGIQNRVLFLGFRKDIQELMACSDIFVMPSFREGVPRALLEAMDLGMPCIGSDTRGIRDLIDLEGGFICNPKKPEEFAAAIKQLKAMSDRSKLGEHNKTKVKNYSAEIVRQELYEIYKEVLT